jgi:hypothetical protein
MRQKLSFRIPERSEWMRILLYMDNFRTHGVEQAFRPAVKGHTLRGFSR